MLSEDSKAREGSTASDLEKQHDSVSEDVKEKVHLTYVAADPALDKRFVIQVLSTALSSRLYTRAMLL